MTATADRNIQPDVIIFEFVFLAKLFILMVFLLIEIEAKPEMESDRKLDKLESFLGRLNNKGRYFLYSLDVLLNVKSS